MDRVRLATGAQDVSHVVRLVQALAHAIEGPQEVDAAHTGAQVLRLMQSPAGVVYVSRFGFIAGEVCATIISPNPVAIEHGWFAQDGCGMLLLDKFEAWAADMGCVGVKMSTGPDAGAASKRLARRGYKPAELAWFR
jgi:hypothetical protein